MVRDVQDLDDRGVRVRTGGGSDGSTGVVLVSIRGVGVVSILEALDVPEATLEKCADETGETVVCISNNSAVKREERRLTMQ
jgi:hypothetical protein